MSVWIANGFTKEELKEMAEAVFYASQVIWSPNGQEMYHKLLKAHGVLLGLSLTAKSNRQINNKVCERCGEPATVYAMDTCANGWGGNYCDNHIPTGFQITDRFTEKDKTTV